MNNIIEILTAAKEAFINGDHARVTALLVPLDNYENRDVAGAACHISGLAFYAMKEIDRAMEQLQKGVNMGHKDPSLYEGYGGTLQQNAKYDQAEDVYKKGLEACGRVPTLLSHWATIELIRGNITHAEDLLKESLLADDSDHKGWTNLGNLFQLRGHYRDAVQCYKEALKLVPSYDSAISNLLLTGNYTRLPKSEVFEAHKKYCSEIVPAALPLKLLNEQNGKIRIGYLSGDFKTHSVAYFFAPLLQFHNRDTFEIYCYSDVHSSDPVTLRFEKQADQWRDIARLSDSEAGQLIQNDNIDILVDLAGHAGGRRLALFKAKPAPVAVTYLGYPNTLGIPEVAYRIIDEITDPMGENDLYYTEELKRVEAPFLCYMPSSDIPNVQPTPVLTKGYITFGSCNNLAKLSDETIEIWSLLLKAVPDSRLYLKSKPLKDEITAEMILRRFEHEGIDRTRITLEGHRSSNRSHLEAYNDIDIALDCFPYNGTTTTCEALIMGVPVLTICGDRHAARVSTSILQAIGHDELAVHSSDEFVRLGARLASDPDQLNQIRSTLRNDLRSSPLADGPRLAKEIETVYMSILKR